MNMYTVVGIFRDIEQPWVLTVYAVRDPMTAAKRAVEMISKKNKDMEVSNIGVLSTFVGDYDDALTNKELLWWNSV